VGEVQETQRMVSVLVTDCVFMSARVGLFMRIGVGM
jgi:hypothetical protein